MTLPPNIKEEIEKEAEQLSVETVDNPSIMGIVLSKINKNTYKACIKIAIQFYERGRQELRAKCAEAYNQGYDVAKSDMKKNRDAIAKAAFEAGRSINETYQVSGGYSYNHHKHFVFKTDADFLASDEYKKLVGDV